MPIVHQMHTAQSFKRSFCKEAFCTSHQSVSVRLTFPPCRYHFNVVASSAVIGFLVMSQCTGGMAWVQMPFSQLSLYSADAKREERDGGGRERETGPYYIFVEAADDTLMNLDHSRSPTQSYIHTRNHTIYANLLIAPLLFPTTTLCSYFQCVRIHIASPDVLSSSLLWAELNHSHRHQPLSKGSWSWEVWPWWKWQKACESEPPTQGE